MIEVPHSSRGRPGVGLESWLVKTIQSGVLKDFPLYYPLRGTVGERPERYAIRLLTELSDSEASAWDREQARDDGRAFRSWAEAPLVPSDAPKARRAGNLLLSPNLGA